ncbi:Leucine-rich_repeat domain superfamily [Hexamita inflata]|uniref:Leucine-rich_repeat domain superfamily n=1 Tax=Hexamita inflata TaxID=28002 RepID=A0ABP1J6J3_9EUKA
MMMMMMIMMMIMMMMMNWRTFHSQTWSTFINWLQKIVNCVNFNGVENVKVLQVNSCELKNFNGIQNWNQLFELNLDCNKLENVTQYLRI